MAERKKDIAVPKVRKPFKTLAGLGRALTSSPSNAGEVYQTPDQRKFLAATLARASAINAQEYRPQRYRRPALQREVEDFMRKFTEANQQPEGSEKPQAVCRRTMFDLENRYEIIEKAIRSDPRAKRIPIIESTGTITDIIYEVTLQKEDLGYLTVAFNRGSVENSSEIRLTHQRPHRFQPYSYPETITDTICLQKDGSFVDLTNYTPGKAPSKLYSSTEKHFLDGKSSDADLTPALHATIKEIEQITSWYLDSTRVGQPLK